MGHSGVLPKPRRPRRLPGNPDFYRETSHSKASRTWSHGPFGFDAMAGNGPMVALRERTAPGGAMDTVVEVEGLTKRYVPLVAVEDVTFQVGEGEIFRLLGPNGAGKTTTVECLQGLRRADWGSIRVLGLDPVADEHALRRRIGCQLH